MGVTEENSIWIAGRKKRYLQLSIDRTYGITENIPVTSGRRGVSINRKSQTRTACQRMAQIFRRSANSVALGSLAGAALAVAGIAWGVTEFNTGSFINRVQVPREQPVPFSHKHHAGGIGIDCRYCHTSVETSAFAGIPPTETCITCHAQIWSDSPTLEPVRASFRNGTSLQWARVHDLPDFVYFNHSIHVNKGIGCSTCHGRVDLMPLTWKVNSLMMHWCIDCHREPERHIRPKEAVFQMDYQPPPNQLELGRRLVAEYKVQKLTDCYTCHR